MCCDYLTSSHLPLCSCSRAFLKIEEAFAALNLGAQLACGAVAIDLGKRFRWRRVPVAAWQPFDHHPLMLEPQPLLAGAAPGGWTSFIVQQGCHVLAVDPADLDAAVEAHPSVTHIRQKSQLAGASIQQQLQLHGGSAQLLLSDMNVHPTQVTCLQPELLLLTLYETAYEPAPNSQRCALPPMYDPSCRWRLPSGRCCSMYNLEAGSS